MPDRWLFFPCQPFAVNRVLSVFGFPCTTQDRKSAFSDKNPCQETERHRYRQWSVATDTTFGIRALLTPV